MIKENSGNKMLTVVKVVHEYRPLISTSNPKYLLTLGTLLLSPQKLSLYLGAEKFK